MTTSALALSLLTLLWQGELGEQRTCALTREMVLVPMGTKLVARSVADGKELWCHVHEERHGILRVPCRIQGLELLPAPIPRLPGLARKEPRKPPPPASVCLAGQKELHCLSLADGRALWRAPKEDGCVLSLHRVGDVDADGTEDVVACGCNYAECFGGRTGAALWKYPVSGRSLWAGPCGDLDGDGLDEVLLQAGTELCVVKSLPGGRVRSLFEVEGFLPRVSLAEKGSVLVAFGGAELWRWGPDGKGEKVWDEKAHLLAVSSCAGRTVIATREGIHVSGESEESGGWKRLPPRRIRAVAFSLDSMVYSDGENVLWRLVPGEGTSRRLSSVTGSVDGLFVSPDGTRLCTLVGGRIRVYRAEPEAPSGEAEP